MNLCQFGLGCFGCCGSGFKKKEDVLREISDNLREFEEYDDKKEFMKRPPYYKPSGICGNIGFINGRIGCLVYPKEKEGDIRKGYCDDFFECRTLKEFKSWKEEKQGAFLTFLEKKNLDVYELSINLDNGALLDEFLKSTS